MDLGNTVKTHRNVQVGFLVTISICAFLKYIVSFNHDQLRGSESDAVEAGNFNCWIQILNTNFGSASDHFVEVPLPGTFSIRIYCSGKKECTFSTGGDVTKHSLRYVPVCL